jgi:hypothetical protein
VYKKTEVQTLVRAFRYSETPPTSAVTTSPAAGGDGIVKPDIVVRSRHSASSTALVTLVGENKVDFAGRPNARAKEGYAQLFLQLLLSFESYGTYLGTAVCKTLMSRVFALRSRTVAVEGKDGSDSTPEALSIRQFLRKKAHFDNLPHDLESDAGFQVLWNIVGDALTLLGNQRADRPLERLFLPPGPVAMRLAKLRPTGQSEAEEDGYGAGVDEDTRWKRDVLAAWATCRQDKKNFAQSEPDYFGSQPSTPSHSTQSSPRRAPAGPSNPKNPKRRRTKAPGAETLELAADNDRADGENQADDDKCGDGRDAHDAVARWADSVRSATACESGVDKIDPNPHPDGEDSDDGMDVGAEASTHNAVYTLYEQILADWGVTVVVVAPTTMDLLLDEARTSAQENSRPSEAAENSYPSGRQTEILGTGPYGTPAVPQPLSLAADMLQCM